MQRSRKSQNFQVLQYMEQHGSITSLEAYEDLRIMRLASRIHDLKEMGYDIRTTTEHYFHDGIYTHYARYSLKR